MIMCIPPSFSCVQMQCMSGLEFHPHQPNLQHTSNPPPSFPESCGHQWAGRPQGVVGGGEVQAGDRNLQWHPWCPWAGPNPAHQSPRPPLILSNRRRNPADLEGPPPASGTRTHRPQPPLLRMARAGLRCRLATLQPTAASRVFLGGAGGRAVPQPSCLWLPAAAPHRP